MSDIYRSRRPGDRAVLQAEAWNAMLDAARAARAARFSGGRGDPLLDARQSGIVPVKNGTGSTVARFGVLKLSSALISPTDNLAEFQRRPMFLGAAPAADTDSVCVVLEPIAAGKIGLAVASGVTVANLSVSDASHEYAAPAAGVTATLASATSGPAKILYKQSGTGTKWGIVQINGPPTPSGVKVLVLSSVEETLAGTVISGGDGAGGVVYKALETTWHSANEHWVNNATTPPNYYVLAQRYNTLLSLGGFGGPQPDYFREYPLQLGSRHICVPIGTYVETNGVTTGTLYLATHYGIGVRYAAVDGGGVYPHPGDAMGWPTKNIRFVGSGSGRGLLATFEVVGNGTPTLDYGSDEVVVTWNGSGLSGTFP